MSNNGSLKIYFYCFPPTLNGPGDYSSGYHYYQHGTVCLGEGLKALGIEFYANVNFWLPSPGQPFLFRYDPNVTPDDCDLVVINDTWWENRFQFPKALFDADHLLRKDRPNQVVLLDLSDDGPRKNFLDAELKRFDYCFKAHLTKSIPLLPNTYPFAFGLSERILKELKNIPPFNQRKHGLLVNFRSSIYGDHSLRNYIKKHFLPKLESTVPIFTGTVADAQEQGQYHKLQWAQASGRHNPGYYKLLLSTTTSSSFGGHFIAPLPVHPWTLAGRLYRKAITKFGGKTDRLVQWDSWRFWEALAAGCVPIHVDFEKYGFILPVMPENWKHYLGIDLDDIDGSIDKISKNLGRLPEISEAGQLWALEHYVPIAVAQRFLETINVSNSRRTHVE
jgi:hypothetical protein